ncbi:hypothetical protein V8E51_013510 [Hyaloscypha variabilis]
MSYISPFAPPATSTREFHQVTGASMVATSSRATPTAQDWERHRPLIKRLYVDERMKLKEVVDFMASQHGHIATPKMYKDRIKKWRLEKKNKESDMLAILRQKTQRDTVGKASAFRVRGQPVTIEEVLQYFKRKRNIRDEEAYNAPTPSDVSCRTPSPGPASLYPENDIPMTEMGLSWKDPSALAEGSHYLSTAPHSQLNALALYPADSVFEREQVIQWTLEDMYNVTSRMNPIPQSPSAPENLHVSERLFYTMKTYLEIQFESSSWFTDEDGDFKVLNTSNAEFNAHANFFDCCQAAVTLLEISQLVEFRRMLAKAFKHVETLIRIQHPGTIECIIETIIYLNRKQHPKIVKLLLRYVINFSTIVWTKDHHLAYIWRLIDALEEDCLEDTVIQSWRCSIVSFEKRLGQFHMTSLLKRLDFIDAVHSLLDTELLFRRLLAQWEEKESSSSNPQIMYILNFLGFNLLNQRRYSEAEQLGLDAMSLAEKQDTVFPKIDCLVLISYAQHGQNKRVLAENNLRRAIKFAVDEWGITDPLAIDKLILLEDWLREWGRVDEADRVRAEIDVAIGRDEIDEEFDAQ